MKGKEKKYRAKKGTLKLKEVAELRGMSMYKVAQEMQKRFKVSPSNVYDWANRWYNPTEDNLRGLCEVLGCKSSELKGF